MSRTWLVTLVLGITTSRVVAQRQPSGSDLEGITARGRMLAGYDVAAWTASDQVTAVKPPTGSITHYIAVLGDRGWQITFGRLSAARDTFFVAYTATQRDDSLKFVVTAHDPALPDVDYFLRAARSVELVRSRFHAEERPYNVAAFPTSSGEWWVYVYPAQVRNGVWPLGGDSRYRVSADGLHVLEERRLHKAIIEYGPVPPGRTVAAMTHNAILDEVPEDTDVLMVLRRSPPVPEIVVTKSFAYRIETDGSIKYLGRRADLVK